MLEFIVSYSASNTEESGCQMEIQTDLVFNIGMCNYLQEVIEEFLQLAEA